MSSFPRGIQDVINSHALCVSTLSNTAVQEKHLRKRPHLTFKTRGNEYMMRESFSSKNGRTLEKSVHAVHRRHTPRRNAVGMHCRTHEERAWGGFETQGSLIPTLFLVFTTAAIPEKLVGKFLEVAPRWTVREVVHLNLARGGRKCQLHRWHLICCGLACFLRFDPATC